MSTEIAPINRNLISPGSLGGARGAGVMDEELFSKLLCIERKRAERSRKQFALGLIDTRGAISTESEGVILSGVLSGVLGTMRETDLIGWYEGRSIVGVIFTELNGTDPALFVATLTQKLDKFLRNKLSSEIAEKIRISFHVFPTDWDGHEHKKPVDFTLYPDIESRDDSRRFPQILKRAMDIGGSAAALLLLSPVLLLIAALIKLTSKGPILFRQERVGQFGKRFQFLKFRSMYHRNNSRMHEDYVRSLIKAGNAAAQGSGVYKLVNDPRVTPLGKFLRRTSLDELPQLWNVLIGQMSLVGPRPPIPYEAISYDVWHRRRILEAKPGITGLWQVTGRSRTTFNEMVRLDLEYARTWSLGLDLKILLRTPGAVFSGDGAY